MKKTICFALCAAILLSLLMAMPINASAATQQQAVNWVKSLNGQRIVGTDGAQCVDLIKHYYAYLTGENSWKSKALGNANKYASNEIPTGFTRYSNTPSFLPQPGDIGVYTGGTYGHVFIVESATLNSMVVWDQNSQSPYNGGANSKIVSHNTGWTGVYYASYFIRPKYDNPTPAPGKPTLSYQYYTPDGISEKIFMWNACTNATQYTLRVYRDGVVVATQMNITDTKIHLVVAPGIYQADVAAVNSNTGLYTFSDKITIAVGVGSRSVSGDFNGDGKDDYATLYDMGKGKMQIHAFLSTGTKFSEEIWHEQMQEGWYHAASVSGRVVAGDFNGDGLCDIATMYDYGNGRTQWHVFLSTGSSFKSWQNWREQTQYPPGQMTDKVIAGDFNGDGKDDIATIYYYNSDGLNEVRAHVWLSDGTKFGGFHTWMTNKQYDGFLANGRVGAGDFNGDGKDDICAIYDYGNNIKVHVWQSTGSGFTGWSDWKTSTQYDARRITGRFAAGDFNGDGKDDVAAMYDYGNGTAKIHTFLSQGSSFTNWMTWWEETHIGYYHANQVSGRFVAGDFNGDGKDDICAIYDYDSTSIKFHIWTPKTNANGFNNVWWNEIKNYNAKRTTGMANYTDNYSPAFYFKKIQQYTITYKANGGSPAPRNQIKWNGEMLTLSATKLTRAGYTFLGWSTNQNATSATYAAGSNFTSDANTTLYAVWRANATDPKYLEGDIDNDGKVDVSDVVALRNIIMTKVFTQREGLAADCDKDGKHDISDVVMLRNLIFKQK